MSLRNGAIVLVGWLAAFGCSANRDDGGGGSDEITGGVESGETAGSGGSGGTTGGGASGETTGSEASGADTHGEDVGASDGGCEAFCVVEVQCDGGDDDDLEHCLDYCAWYDETGHECGPVADVLYACLAELSCAELDVYWAGVEPYPCQAENEVFYACWP
jgi:hypothetical protein